MLTTPPEGSHCCSTPQHGLPPGTASWVCSPLGLGSHCGTSRNRTHGWGFVGSSGSLRLAGWLLLRPTLLSGWSGPLLSLGLHCTHHKTHFPHSKSDVNQAASLSLSLPPCEGGLLVVAHLDRGPTAGGPAVGRGHTQHGWAAVLSLLGQVTGCATQHHSRSWVGGSTAVTSHWGWPPRTEPGA